MQFLQTFIRFIWVHFVLVNLQNNQQISAAVAYGKAEMSKSRGPSHCDMGGEGGEHEVGVAWEAEGMCGLAMCSQRGEQICGMEWTPPGCVKEVQPGLAYPACCPQVVCPQDSDRGFLIAAAAQDQDENTAKFGDVQAP